MEKPIILFDTDMDTDCDDAGALAMLLEAHLADKAILLGIVADSVSPYAAPACDYMAHHYGIELPIGTVYAEDYMDTPENLCRLPYPQQKLSAAWQLQFILCPENKQDGQGLPFCLQGVSAIA